MHIWPGICDRTRRQKRTMQARLEALNDFPNSQHWPILITTRIKIPHINSFPKSRWNFRITNWEHYANHIEASRNRIPITQENIRSFTGLMLKSAKLNIPREHRERYIPCRTKRSVELLREYEQSQDNEVADRLLASLQENREKRWEKLWKICASPDLADMVRN